MLVTPLVMVLVLAIMQLGLTAYSRSVLAAAAEDAVRTAAAFGGDTAAGEARFRSLVASELGPGSITGLQWYSTLDTLTLRVHSRLPIVGALVPLTLTTDASAYHEEWP